MATKINVYLLVGGKEKLAKGDNLYSWDYKAQPADNDYEDAPAGSTLLGSIEAELPTPASCIPDVLAKIAAEEKSLRNELNENLRELAERREKLLALTNEVPHESA